MMAPSLINETTCPSYHLLNEPGVKFEVALKALFVVRFCSDIISFAALLDLVVAISHRKVHFLRFPSSLCIAAQNLLSRASTNLDRPLTAILNPDKPEPSTLSPTSLAFRERGILRYEAIG
jgi:hypothetical protein